MQVTLRGVKFRFYVLDVQDRHAVLGWRKCNMQFFCVCEAVVVGSSGNTTATSGTRSVGDAGRFVDETRVRGMKLAPFRDLRDHT